MLYAGHDCRFGSQSNPIPLLQSLNNRIMDLTRPMPIPKRKRKRRNTRHLLEAILRGQAPRLIIAPDLLTPSLFQQERPYLLRLVHGQILRVLLESGQLLVDHDVAGLAIAEETEDVG